MKKLIALTLVATLALSACNSKWNPDYDTPPELEAKYEEIIKENKDILKEYDSTDAAYEVAVAYYNLGKWKTAVKYYEQILEWDTDHESSLNNLADIYEKVGDIEKAAEYIKLLYPERPNNQQAIIDVVRILLKADDPENAQLALENYIRVRTERGDYDEAQIQLTGGLFQQIMEYSQEHSK